MTRTSSPARIDPIDARLIERLHGDFPLCDEPFAELADELGMAEADVMARLQQMLADGLLTRFGPLFQIERAGGQFVLAAMAVPEDRFDEVAERVNALPEVAHNYRREHELNMWFVLGAEREGEITRACHSIEAAPGLPVYPFPKEREYFVELRLPVEVPA